MKKTIASLMLIFTCLSMTTIYAEEVSKVPTAISIEDTDISADQLNLMISHLTSDELFVEADGWLELLKEAVKKVNQSKLTIGQKNDEIDSLKALDTNETTAEEKESIKQKLDKAKEEKSTLLEIETKLLEDRQRMVKRLDTILENINEKIGMDKTGNELDKVLPYRRYINSVSGISLEVTDAESAWTIIYGWVMSEEGGILWLINLVKFIVIILVAFFVSNLLRKGVKRALEFSHSNSKLLNDFIANIIHKLVMLVGLLVALAALDINVGPIMAMVGAAGFVIAFALQGTLSNFASGIMIMLYRPYDIGDVIDVSGAVGTVQSMTLVSTSIVTFDNRLMVVPNNSIWGNIITNVTHSPTRRVDMTFGIGYNDNIEKAQKVMEEILEEHALVLKSPEPTVKVHELADSSVNFICRPWVKTADYWTVYWEVTRAVKERFDEKNISIPYPQMDIHLDPTKT